MSASENNWLLIKVGADLILYNNYLRYVDIKENVSIVHSISSTLNLRIFFLSFYPHPIFTRIFLSARTNTYQRQRKAKKNLDTNCDERRNIKGNNKLGEKRTYGKMAMITSFFLPLVS